jgi:enoyl-CoA hydratase
MGLANRLTEPGGALAGALELARDLARLPQTCLRRDRLSTYEQWALPLDAAMAAEFEHGRVSLAATDEMGAGLDAFGGGAGRHGASA